MTTPRHRQKKYRTVEVTAVKVLCAECSNWFDLPRQCLECSNWNTCEGCLRIESEETRKVLAERGITI
jgi:hypothetical protein